MDTTQESKRIEMKFLRKSGYLCGWAYRSIAWTCRGEDTGNILVKINTDTYQGGSYMELDYKIRSRGEEEWRPINYRVTLVSTPCRYGGKRWWFICPNTRCNRRNNVLYSYGDYFVCRKCARLKYESQRYSGKYAFVSRILDADEYAMTLKRWYYRGKPTRKHRKLIRMRHGMDEMQALRVAHAMLTMK